jgi:O-antigen/teichoic acid export membrane protein
MSGRRMLEALGQAAMPRLARLWATDKHAEFRRLLLQLVAIGSGCAVTGFLVVFFWGGPLLTFVYTEEYAEHSRILVWLMASWGLRYPSAFLAGGLVATRRFLLVPRVYMPSVVAAVVSGVLLIPQHGILGAAWADMISAVLQLILTIFVGRDLLAVKATG